MSLVCEEGLTLRTRGDAQFSCLKSLMDVATGFAERAANGATLQNWAGCEVKTRLS